MPLTSFDEQAPKYLAGEIAHGDGAGRQTIVNVLYNILRIDALWSVNTDTVANVVTLWIEGVEACSAIVPARAGLDGTPPVDMLADLAAMSGWAGLVLPVGVQVEMQLATLPSVDTKVLVVGTGGLIPSLVGL